MSNLADSPVIAKAVSILVAFLGILALALIVWLAVYLVQKNRRAKPDGEKSSPDRISHKSVGFYNPITEEELYPDRVQEAKVELVEDDSPKPVEGFGENSAPGDPLFCRKCGRKIPADSAFCQYCGTEIICL